MDWTKLLAIAGKLNVPGLAERGFQIAADTAEFVAEVKNNAARAAHVLADGDQAELDAIHAEALAIHAALDAKLAAAEQRGK